MPTKEAIELARIKRIGKPRSPETKRKLSEFFKGKPLSVQTRLKMSVIRKANREQSNFWKGGISKTNLLIRASIEYKLWRESVFKRDNYTCVLCGESPSGKLNADHIKPFALYPELRFALDNGRTLCIDCHKKTDSYLNNKITNATK